MPKAPLRDRRGGPPTPATLRERLLARAERHLPALTRLRRSESLPILLERRRIYVLPTRFGMGFSVLLFVMLIGALNYSNNPAVLLTCLLGAASWASLFLGFRGLSGLRLMQLRADECLAGDPMKLEMSFATGRPRASLRLSHDDVETPFCLMPGESQPVIAEVATHKRGWLKLGRLRVTTNYPLGLFVVWSWMNPDTAFLVFPKPEQPVPPLPLLSGRMGDVAAQGSEEEFVGLREYRSSDPPRLIAWKASARLDNLLVRESESRAGTALVFDYTLTGVSDREARISRLTAWVLSAEAAGANYTLRLPDASYGPSAGAAQRFACLRALALLPAHD
ncbi:MAG: DUF58 domain-containing protein [Dokdonella sp.]